MKTLLVTIAVTVLLAGCVTEHMPIAPTEANPAQVKLAEAGVAVTHSLQTMAAIRKAELPFYNKLLPNPRTFGMNDLASIDWTGPIGPLVRELADASNYRLRVLGRPPAIPIIIAVIDKDVPLAEILRDADHQAGAKANIVVYPAQRTIELRYNKSDYLGDAINPTLEGGVVGD